LEAAYERLLSVALRFPAVTLALAVAAIGVGVILYSGIPKPGKPEPGKPREWLMSGIQTGLLPNMDEGAFVLDYLAPTGTPLQETEKLAQPLEHVLNENPDVDVYVRRTGTELGLFATKTNRGDIQVVLRPAENDPISLMRKRERPEFEKVEEELK